MKNLLICVIKTVLGRCQPLVLTNYFETHTLTRTFQEVAWNLLTFLPKCNINWDINYLVQNHLHTKSLCRNTIGFKEKNYSSDPYQNLISGSSATVFHYRISYVGKCLKKSSIVTALSGKMSENHGIDDITCGLP